MRKIVNAIFYVLWAGCPWRMLLRDFPPMMMVYGWLLRFRRDGLFETIKHHLVILDRVRVGRGVNPSATVIDSQSVKTTEAGYARAKKNRGCKRHAMVNTNGRSLVLQAHAANVQDRDGAILLFKALRLTFPFAELAFAELAFADSVCNGDRVSAATPIAIEIVKKPTDQVGFRVLPRRWVVEQCFAWINRNRRLAKDFEGTVASGETFLYAASVMPLTRRLA